MGRVVRAVEFIHSHGVIHQDIKPANLIVDQQGQPRLVDFGTACRHSKDNSSYNGGTPCYMAPEVAEDRHHSFTADYYALGIMTYELFFQKKPYPSVSKDQILSSLMAKPLTPENFPELNSIPTEASQFIQQVPPPLTQLVQRRPSLRLGHNGISEITTHPFLNGSLKAEEESGLKSILTSQTSTGSVEESTMEVGERIK